LETILLWLKDYGIAGGFIFGAVAFVFNLFCKKINGLAKKIEDSTGKVTNIHVALSDDKGKPIVQHDILRELVTEVKHVRHKLHEHDTASQKHYDDVCRLADDNKVRDCDVAKCLHIAIVTDRLESITALLSQIEETNKEGRHINLDNQTGLRLQMTELTRDILATLRVFKGGNE
jgi:hypothetical protein